MLSVLQRAAARWRYWLAATGTLLLVYLAQLPFKLLEHASLERINHWIVAHWESLVGILGQLGLSIASAIAVIAVYHWWLRPKLEGRNGASGEALDPTSQRTNVAARLLFLECRAKQFQFVINKADGFLDPIRQYYEKGAPPRPHFETFSEYSQWAAWLSNRISEDFSETPDLNKTPNFDSNPYGKIPGDDGIKEPAHVHEYRRFYDRVQTAQKTVAMYLNAYKTEMASTRQLMGKEAGLPIVRQR